MCAEMLYPCVMFCNPSPQIYPVQPQGEKNEQQTTILLGEALPWLRGVKHSEPIE